MAISQHNEEYLLAGIFGSFTWAFAAAASDIWSVILSVRAFIEKVAHLIRSIVSLSTGMALVFVSYFEYSPAACFLSIYGQSEEFIAEGVPVIRVISVAMIN